jgi:hypothetical protein
MLSHPPYSPELGSAGVALFSALEMAMKGTRFEAVPWIPRTMTRELKSVRERAFPLATDSLYEQFEHYAEAGGYYIG